MKNGRDNEVKFVINSHEAYEYRCPGIGCCSQVSAVSYANDTANALFILQYRFRIFLLSELLWITLGLEVEWEFL